ncbi:MAG: hypothetical protein ACE14S_01275 [Candidatus Bathyarchaeia archaeon]
MRTIFKVLLILFALFVAAAVIFAALVFLDLAAYTATGSETLTPNGASVGSALVVYDPGLSGAAKDVASKVASTLQANGYTVTFAGIKSAAAANTTGYQVVVVGGPIYAGTPTGSVKEFLRSLNAGPGVRVGVFGSGGGAEEAGDVDLIRNSVTVPPDAVIVKIGSGENLDVRCADFVARLLS